MNNLLITHYYPPGFFIVKTNLSPEDWLAQASQLAWQRADAANPEELDTTKDKHSVYIFDHNYFGNDVEVKYYDSAEDIANSYKAELISYDFAMSLYNYSLESFGVCGPLFLPQHRPEYDWGDNKRG